MPEMPGEQGMGHGQAKVEGLVEEAIKAATKGGTFHISPHPDDNVSKFHS